MDHFDLPALTRASGTIRLPGSKSISNRMLLLAALADGETEIRDLLDSDDTKVMLAALRKVGVGVTASAATPGKNAYRITGCAGVFPGKDADLFMGNAGTAIRPLTATLALSGGHYRISGVPRMHERPIGDLVDGLRQIGCDVRYTGNDGYPPLEIFPADVKLDAPIRVRGDVSSQFLTALLMALPLTGKTAVIEMTTELISKPYIEITLNLMARFGVTVERAGWQRFTIAGGQAYRSPGVVHVEGDASGASYFLAAGVIGGGPVRVEGVGRQSIQGDVRFADALETMGAQITWGDNFIEARAPATGKLKAFDLDLNHIPDAAMTLAVAALFADGPCVLRNIASWRVKETDRITAMATELRKLGATVEEGADYLVVSPVSTIAPGVAIDTYDDHRVAMCFALVALGGVPVRINDPGCVAKTFPHYFDAFGEIAAPVIAIDGPSASGKGTVAQRVAAELGFHFLDSGALYRLTALAALRAGVALEDEMAVAGVATQLAASFAGEQILLAGDDVTAAIRAEEIGVGASKVAALPAVRSALFARQRAYRRFPGLVADGRDMGSVIFPEAQVKVFLTASAAARAERRYKQLIDKGMPANMHALLQDLQERDARDAARSVAPLRQCDDAELVDTTPLGIDGAVAAVMGIVRRKLLLK
ncbi:MAG: bifunctional 3-phosphoshikimate 1-carboxyvinyltransferase/cytidylate kinase [Gammaproteobacteria bacterium]|nr:bifunctional 3-phosphoshikimate 1-carboxyvinyltransferase/cytidylate kinase [Rhodocyclaceae bacterium]MBU3908516.1 bifunctional 3-phosphoshikimate 1-carboxyvinyltransferase/cytidylate kinase [Gammaproteobacteria bacterium]MBU3990497.1 bifunctional 3-phosphoshikimate 1-carboxyvinyltransferase/cytidylate kinase [Gammaproteobacteria bacterium]MBU4004544.1 bifunctional 3-phosphoshikimate 1-carboxyvinyltransferase/cytidylate kinase [Gammaproteobacteria bacterium]MBU4021147.1 bifunctional 3-phosph